MFYHAYNGNVKIEDTTMDYIRFGSGKTPLVIIPGLGDGLKTVRGAALPFALMYREFAKDFTVYVFSRRAKLRPGFTTADAADDLAYAMAKLGIERADVLGVSMGGMIAQCLAVHYPSRVQKLVLVVTLCRPNATIEKVIGAWIELAKQGNYDQIFVDISEKSYSEKHLKGYRKLYPLLCKITKPKSLERFLVQADACINHRFYEEIAEINCPTFVIGGAQDKTVGPDAAAEVAGRIAGSKLKIYSEYGHGTYEEAPDFKAQVLAFLLDRQA